MQIILHGLQSAFIYIILFYPESNSKRQGKANTKALRNPKNIRNSSEKRNVMIFQGACMCVCVQINLRSELQLQINSCCIKIATWVPSQLLKNSPEKEKLSTLCREFSIIYPLIHSFPRSRFENTEQLISISKDKENWFALTFRRSTGAKSLLKVSLMFESCPFLRMMPTADSSFGQSLQQTRVVGAEEENHKDSWIGNKKHKTQNSVNCFGLVNSIKLIFHSTILLKSTRGT